MTALPSAKLWVLLSQADPLKMKMVPGFLNFSHPGAIFRV